MFGHIYWLPSPLSDISPGIYTEDMTTGAWVRRTGAVNKCTDVSGLEQVGLRNSDAEKLHIISGNINEHDRNSKCDV